MTLFYSKDNIKLTSNFMTELWGEGYEHTSEEYIENMLKLGYTSPDPFPFTEYGICYYYQPLDSYGEDIMGVAFVCLATEMDKLSEWNIGPYGEREMLNEIDDEGH